MTFPHTHKTVFVLDRSPAFLQSSGEFIEYDVSKSKVAGFIPAAPICKSMWTCNVEIMTECMRIIYDVFPARKLFQVITSDTGSQKLSTWALKEQNLQQFMLGLAHLGPPHPGESEECSLMHGLTQAVEVLCEPTEAQHNVRTSLTEDAACLLNHGAVLCMTTLKSEAYIRILEECVHDAIVQHNQLAASTDNLLPINHCELLLIHVTPVDRTSKIVERPRREVSSLLSSEVYTSQSGSFLYSKMRQIVQRQYNLMSTTVTGIPMKEEQNASLSANYDVELLHHAQAHDDILKSVSGLEGVFIPSKEIEGTGTVTLRWSTPKSSSVELFHCTGAFRISPGDVNSRPSACLTNFLLGGRSVMLEQPRKTGFKVISHMLTCHGGEIFIHTLCTTRTILEDPGSISEGCGGRVTDYRITDFAEFMKENKLAPATQETVLTMQDLPIEKAKVQLERMTRVWPILISESIIFNMLSSIDPLQSLIIKEELTEEEVLDCKKAIFYVVGMETRNEQLPVSASQGAKGSRVKRDDQYRLMWSELESFVRAYSDLSSNHEKVLECLLECKKPSEDTRTAPSPKRGGQDKPVTVVKEEKMEVVSEAEQAWKDFDKFQKMTEREKHELIKGDNRWADSTPAKKSKPFLDTSVKKPGEPQNLLSMWTNRIQAIHSKRHVEFVGRLESYGNKAELYQPQNEDNKEETGDGNTGQGKS